MVEKLGDGGLLAITDEELWADVSEGGAIVVWYEDMGGRGVGDDLVPGQTEHDAGALPSPVDHQVQVTVVQGEHGAHHLVLQHTYWDIQRELGQQSC